MSAINPHTPWPVVARTALLAAVAVCVVLLAFAWPSVTAKVQQLPVAVIGSTEQVAQLSQKAPEGALDIKTAPDRADAAHKIEQREIYGAIILGNQPEILVSSAASPLAAQMLTQIGGQLQSQIQQQAIAGLQKALTQGLPAGAAAGAPATIPTVKITDVVPLSPDDARGTGLAVAGLPLAMGGIVGGVLISLLVTGTWRRLAAVGGYAVLGGLGLTSIMQGWLHILQGDFLLNALAIFLAVGATAAAIVGFNAFIGRAGIAVGSVLTMFIGNPLSSLTQPKEFLPGPWGEIGQWFVPGSSGTLLRDLSYFPETNTTFPWLVLAGWLVAGVVLTMVGHFRDQSGIPQHENVVEEQVAEHRGAHMASV
ncbi:ABC transporter permease [Renibacterium salmoninarum]|nr:ABC transporter permease [Renibacterium salmoninarum]